MHGKRAYVFQQVANGRSLLTLTGMDTNLGSSSVQGVVFPFSIACGYSLKKYVPSKQYSSLGAMGHGMSMPSVILYGTDMSDSAFNVAISIARSPSGV